MEEEQVFPAILFYYVTAAIVAHDFLIFSVAQPMQYNLSKNS
jgi:hypothetical protein